MSRYRLKQARLAGLRKPTDDDVRVRTVNPDIDLAGGSDGAVTCCCWLRDPVMPPDVRMLVGNAKQGNRGFNLWFLDATQIQFVFLDTAFVNRAITITHGVSAGEWAFYLGSVDAAGNARVRANDIVGSTLKVAPSTSGFAEHTNVLAHVNGSRRNLSTIADVQIYDNQLSEADEVEIMRSQGRYTAPGLLSRLLFDNAASGVDTDSVVPVDVADPGRDWEAAGIGDANIFDHGLYPLRWAS